jgi:flagellar protein FlaJ
MWWLLPLLVSVTALGLCAFVPVSVTVRGYFTRVAMLLFGSYVRKRADAEEHAESTRERMGRLQAAHYVITYRTYAARTLMYATLFAVAGSVIAVYLVWGVIIVLNLSTEAVASVLPAQLSFLTSFLTAPTLSNAQLFGILLASNVTLGLLFGYVVYWARWYWPGYVADERGREIDQSLQRTVAFMYALSRSGMAFPEVMRILSRNQAVYGEAAAEVGVAVRDMDVFGTDMVEAIRRAANRTPSERMEEFFENLVSVLQSGRSISAFLSDQYDYFEEENETEQAQFLELLATLAEGYVTVLVAGPLFLITILVIIGLVLGGTLDFLRALVYALIPLASVGFLVYLDSITGIGSAEIERTVQDSRAEQFKHIRNERRETAGDGGLVGWFDGEYARNAARLSAHNRFRRIANWAEHPIENLSRNPTTLLYITVPAAALSLGIRTWTLYETGTLTVASIDDSLVQATLFVVGTFAVVHEINRRRIKSLEATVPDFLGQLASINEAGTPIVESIKKVAGNNLGALNDELDRTWSDITWGARVENALWRFEERLNTPVVTRAVTLITNAMAASGDIGPVLRIAADEAQATRRLRRERRQELLTYVVVIYLSFLVFLTIIVALNVMFLPNIPTTEQFGGSVGGSVPGVGGGIGGIGGLDEATKSKYELLFFHAALVQAVCSGFIAGQMGDGSIGAGAKHAAAMLAIAYGLFVFLG